MRLPKSSAIYAFSLIDAYVMMGYKTVHKYNIVVGTAPDCELMLHGKSLPRKPLACDDEEGRLSLRRLGEMRRLFDISVQCTKHTAPKPQDSIRKPEERTVFEQDAQRLERKRRHQSTP